MEVLPHCPLPHPSSSFSHANLCVTSTYYIYFFLSFFFCSFFQILSPKRKINPIQFQLYFWTHVWEGLNFGVMRWSIPITLNNIPQMQIIKGCNSVWASNNTNKLLTFHFFGFGLSPDPLIELYIYYIQLRKHYSLLELSKYWKTKNFSRSSLKVETYLLCLLSMNRHTNFIITKTCDKQILSLNAQTFTYSKFWHVWPTSNMQKSKFVMCWVVRKYFIFPLYSQNMVRPKRLY